MSARPRESALSSPFAVPVRRPVATSMFFLALVLLGFLGWDRIPVELFPDVAGDELYVSFFRPGSDPDLVEREILIPLEAKLGEISGVKETEATITGSSGLLTVRFNSGIDLRVRELDLRRIGADLQRSQPNGTFIDVTAFDSGVLSRFVMVVQISGETDLNSLRSLVEERIEPRLAAVPGVAQVQSFGGAPQEISVEIDPDLAASVGVDTTQVTSTLSRVVARSRYVGGAETANGREAVIVDGRPAGPIALSNLRVSPGSPARLRHVAKVEQSVDEPQEVFRVDGLNAAAAVIFKTEDSNLVEVGRALRARVDKLNAELSEEGVQFGINFDGADVVEEQLDRLKGLAASGFLIALVVLFGFLRRLRAVLVVAISVPVSMAIALALLYLFGQSINLVTLFGLAVALGMLVDNSIVVYEAVQRQLERGAEPDEAAATGAQRTARAILASTATNAVVFLPLLYVDFEQSILRDLVELLAMAYLLPLTASLLVGLGLVPLLARHLAAPAAIARIRQLKKRRMRYAGLLPPDRGREMFTALLVVALRRPGLWLAGTALAVFVTTLVALSWLVGSMLSTEAAESTTVRLQVEIDDSRSLENAVDVFEQLEGTVAGREGVEQVTSLVREGEGSLTVELVDQDERPDDVSPRLVRGRLTETANRLSGVSIVTQSASGDGQTGGVAEALGQGGTKIVVSGPDARRLQRLADGLRNQLKEVPEISSVRVSTESGRDELWVTPERTAILSMGLLPEEVLYGLPVVRREGQVMQVGLPWRDDREIDLVVRRKEAPKTRTSLTDLRLTTHAGVVPLSATSQIRQMPAPPVIRHRDGRRELEVEYRFKDDAPQVGPARVALDTRIQDIIRRFHRPAGYTIDPPDVESSTSWFKKLLLPILLLLFAALAVTFESLVVPFVVLIALPLTLIGGVWALLIAGLPADPMAMVGVVALLGLTINPAILLVDRMQQRVRGGLVSPGAAALAAVRERARPVLMTTITTVAGLWPLALSTGRENEIWPPFATVVMGGLATSTLLTLLIIPLGYVIVRRLDSIFGRLGPWVVIAWLASIALVIYPLVWFEVVTSITWQIVITLLVGGFFLAFAVLVLWRQPRPEPARREGQPPQVEVRFLHKTYGEYGPLGHAWRLPEIFARRVLNRGGIPFDPSDAKVRFIPLVMAFIAAIYLITTIESGFWRTILTFGTAMLARTIFQQVRRARGRVDDLGKPLPGGFEGWFGALAPWGAFSYVAWRSVFGPWFSGAYESAGASIGRDVVLLSLLAALVAFIQLGRWTATRLARKEIEEKASGRLRRLRSSWRTVSQRLFGFDLPREQVSALKGVEFTAESGMIGILGPNGAGKTTLLRQLSGILSPSRGVIRIGGVPLDDIRKVLARYVGYLPQDFGLPNAMTAREYLEYYAMLYDIEPQSVRTERIEKLLEEVGLKDRANEKIGGYSGGMRQRVAVARTLLRLPEIIIVDEPTVGLDPRERIRFRNLLTKLSKGRIILFSTHVVEDVAVACERVLVMSKGKLVFDGRPDNLSEAATGRVWRVPLASGANLELEKGATVVDQLPTDDGGLQLRVLSQRKPHADAAEIEPTLEDGYLSLVGLRRGVQGA